MHGNWKSHIHRGFNGNINHKWGAFHCHVWPPQGIHTVYATYKSSVCIYIYIICLSKWHMMPLCTTLDVSIWWYGVWFSLNMAVFLERESYWIWIMTCVWPCLESKVPRWFALICYAVWVCHKVRDAEGWSERTTPCGSWVHRFEVQGGRRNDLTNGKQSLFCSSLVENPWVSLCKI